MKMSIRVILKSGVEFVVKCDSFSLEKTALGVCTGYHIDGIVENKPLYLDLGEIAAIVRVLSDETEVQGDG